MSSADYQAMLAASSQKINLADPNSSSAPRKAPKGYEVSDQRVVQIYPLEEEHAASPSEREKKSISLDVDIVFVPGLGADPIESWKSSNSDFNWMKDETGIQSQFPRARLLLYKYESAYNGGFKVKQDIENLANTLLVALSAKRETCKARPIVFIGHSMGGLVIAKAIILASIDVGTSRDVFNTTTGCIFFGTPFRGASIFSSITAYAVAAEKQNKGAIESTLLDLLQPDNRELRQLRIEFTRLATTNNQTISCHCFWEQRESDITKLLTLINGLDDVQLEDFHLPEGKTTMFVKPDSATLESCKTTGLQCDHRGLVKIDNLKEDGLWAQVKKPLREIVDGAQSAVKSRLNAVRNIDLPMLSDIMNVLEGGQIRRKEEILLQSFVPSSWIPSEDEYKSWLGDEPSADEKPVDCLFIRGREGRGKTSATLAALDGIRKVQYAKNNAGEDDMLAYFFCDTESDYSTAEDVLKSLIRQLLSQRETLAPHAAKFTKRQKTDDKATKQIEAKASVENLWQSLQGMLSDPLIGNKVYFVLNNLHTLPAESESTKKLMSYINTELGAGQSPRRVKTRWFLTSQSVEDFPNVSNDNRLVRVIDLGDPKHKSKVQSELERHAKKKVTALGEKKKYNKALSYFASSLIGRRAQNTQWIDILCIQLEELSTDSDLTVRDILESTPQDLKTLLSQAWKQIFQLNRDKAGKMKEILRTMILTYEDPSEMELGVLAGFSSTDEQRVELHSIIGQCRPLLCVQPTDGDNPTVSFINAVVKTHLFENAKALLGLSREGIKWQQGVLAHRCFSHIKEVFDYPKVELEIGPTAAAMTKDDQEALSFSQDGQDVLDKIAKGIAAAYAVKHWLHHASKATPDIADELSLEAFWKPDSLIRWRWLAGYCRLTTVLAGFHCKTFNALHVAASVGFSQLVGALIRNGHKEEVTQRDELWNTPLHLAAWFGRVNTVDELLRSDAPVDDCIDINHQTPLFMAAARGHISVMQKLLHRGANPNAMTTKEGPVLNAAIASGNISAVKLLVGYDKQKVSLTRAEGSPDGVPRQLTVAAMIADDEMFEYLMNSFQGSIPELDYIEAVYVSASLGKVGRFQLLLDHPMPRQLLHSNSQLILDGVGQISKDWDIFKILMNKSQGWGLNVDKLFFTAAACNQNQDEVVRMAWNYAGGAIARGALDGGLYHAADGEKESTVILLLQYGADPNAVLYDPSGKMYEYGNALTASAFDGTESISRLLLAANANPNHPQSWALQIAAGQGHVHIVKLLLQYGANVNAVSPYFPQGSAIQAACEAGSLEIVQLLLRHGANPNLGAGIASPPIIAAAKRGQAEILDALVNAGAQLNVFGGPDKSTPLINAAAYLPTTSLQTLLNRGANINLPDQDGNTALIISAARGDIVAVRFLLANGADLLHFNNNYVNALIAAYSNQQSECLRELVVACSSVLLCFKILITNNKVDLSALALLAAQGGKPR
ncbi:hypothetical protein MKX08_003372 [Trichoderma sp. CBMAI-0020]|nr:hypothetical protein MKX08_003372 [Trichoderma sp. CBMAI-0020]